MPEQKESKEKRFGVIAIEQGFITKEQLMAALEIQVKEDLELGRHRLMGVILNEMGALDASQIKTVVNNLIKLSSVAV